MTSLRLTILMFVIGAALAPVLIFGWGSPPPPAGGPAAAPGVPAVTPSMFTEAGLKRIPWEGEPAPPSAAPGEGTAAARAEEPKVEAPRAPVVVELFTSEGCSSCPPADRLLASLIREHASDSWFFPIAFHVDYWDRLGWVDAFASPQATARQNEYAAVKGNSRVYTPQMVVNGDAELVGSDRERAVKAIEEAHRAAAAVSLAATSEPIVAGSSVQVRAEVRAEVPSVGSPARPLADQARLVAVLVEDGLSSKVRAGENKGLELSHERVVRAMAIGAIGKDGRAAAELKVPKDAQPARCEVIALVQAGPGGKVLGAAHAPVKIDEKKPGEAEPTP